MQTIGKQAAPSVVAAQRIKIDAQGIDADLADELISVPGQDYQAVTNYEQRLAAVHRDLITLSQGISAGALLQDVNQHLAEYEEATQRARDYHQQHDSADLAAYRESLHTLQTNLLAPADNLQQASASTLQVTYALWQLSLGIGLLWIVFWVRSLFRLMALRTFMRERFHYWFYRPLFVVMVTNVLFFLPVCAIFVWTTSKIHVAKADAYDSLSALLAARADSYAAKAAESRWLLDRPDAPIYAKAFQDQVARVAKSSENESFAAIADLFTTDSPPGRITGYLGDELHNITFPGEREAAVLTLRSFGAFTQIDQEIRQLENSGEHAKAVDLCIGRDPGESNWAFAQVNDALGQTLEINQEQFAATMNGALLGIYLLYGLLLLITLPSLVLVWAGAQKHLLEYLSL